MRVLEFLSEQGVDFAVKHHEEYFTAQEEAAAQGLSGNIFAKTVIVRLGGETPVMLVLPASYRVDLERVDAILGETVRLAEEADVGALFPDCELGAEPPFGSQYGMKTVVDKHLAAQPTLALRAGKHTEVVLMSWDDFVKLESPTVAAFAEPPL